MKKTILTAVAAALMFASAAPMAMAAERHHVRKTDRAPLSEQFRNANDSVLLPAAPVLTTRGFDSSYADGHAISAPAGR